MLQGLTTGRPGAVVTGPGGVPWYAARVLAHAVARPLRAQHVALNLAGGLTLAEDLLAKGPLPAFDTAAMDGYAVRDPGPYRLCGQISAGSTAAGSLRRGEAIAISTGAPVPAGTTAILRLEDATCADGLVSGPKLAPGRHIRQRGEDATTGLKVAPAGSAIGPAMLGLAATCGYDRLVVTPRPLVQLIITGDELSDAGVSEMGRVRDALGPMLPDLIAEMGGEVTDMMHVPDQPAGCLTTRLQRLDAGGASVVVVTGSTSVGPSDQLRQALHHLDAQWVVDTVACRPGRPQLLAGLGTGRWIVGLPGNPFAAFVAAQTLVAPLLAGLRGRPLPPLPTAELVGDVRRPAPGQTHLLPVAWEGGAVRVLDGTKSTSLRGAALADALAAIPGGWDPGQQVPIVLTRGDRQ
jgi:molybdopterin molybdotransferase